MDHEQFRKYSIFQNELSKSIGRIVAVVENYPELKANSTFLKLQENLVEIEDNIQKLDSAFEATVQLLDCPNKSFSLNKTIEQLSDFNGKVIIQTLFVNYLTLLGRLNITQRLT